MPGTGPGGGTGRSGTGPCERRPVGPLDGSVPARDLEPVAALFVQVKARWAVYVPASRLEMGQLRHRMAHGLAG